MKTTLLILLVSAAALLAQIEIPLDQPVTVQQPVTTTQNVTVTTVPTAAITFDLVGERITFRLAGNQTTSNSTITLSGAEYQAIKTQFLNPFAQSVAPTLREKLQE